MAASSCPKCDSHTFETTVETPTGSHYKLLFVQCAMCGAVVGVMDYYNIGAVLGDIADSINEVAKVLNISKRIKF